MAFLSEEQVKARDCLRSGSYLTDPKYSAPHLGLEEKLKERCRACWKLREFFPQWVTNYIAKWALEKKPVIPVGEEDFA